MTRRLGHPRAGGATLVEMVAVILVLAIAAITIMDQFANSARSYQTNETLQTAAQLAQECAEQILATRRLQDYATAIISTCPNLPASYTAAGYARTVFFGTAPAACVTTPCSQVDVVVTYNAAEQARVVFMLGNY